MTDPADRLRKLRDDMATKSRHLLELHDRTDNNGKISPEAANDAAIAAGVREAPAPPPPPTDEVRLARLQAAQKHGLTLAQVDAMTATTEAAIEAEAIAITIPPGDGGARGMMPRSGGPFDEQIREAELAGDIDAAMSLKSQKLLAVSEEKAARNHPNALK